MNEAKTTIDLEWKGPFPWPGHEEDSGLPPPPESPALYLMMFLMMFEYENGYLIYSAGLTRRTVPSGFASTPATT